MFPTMSIRNLFPSAAPKPPCGFCHGNGWVDSASLEGYEPPEGHEPKPKAESGPSMIPALGHLGRSASSAGSGSDRSDGWPPSTLTLLGDDSHSCAEERANTLWAVA
jgi:hypothetical protein